MSDQGKHTVQSPQDSGVLENPQVYDLLVSKINDRVNEGIRKRNESLRNWLIGIFTLVVISVAAGGPPILRGYVGDAVAPAVEKAVAHAVGEAVAPAVGEAVTSAVGEAVTSAEEFRDAIRFDLEVTALNLRMLNLDLSEAFSEEDARSIITEIQSLVSNGTEQRRGKLASAVDTAVKNFAAADRLDLVIELEDIVPDLFQNSSIITQTMLQASGFTLLADAGAPNSWTDTTGSRSDIHKKYRKYANRAEFAGYPELYLLYEVLLGYIERRSAEEIENLIADIDSLGEEDSVIFVQMMTSLASEEIVMKPTAQSKRVASWVTAFLCEYKEKGRLLQIVFQQLPIVFQQEALRCQAQNP